MLAVIPCLTEYGHRLRVSTKYPLVEGKKPELFDIGSIVVEEFNSVRPAASYEPHGSTSQASYLRVAYRWWLYGPVVLCRESPCPVARGLNPAQEQSSPPALSEKSPLPVSARQFSTAEPAQW